MIFKQTKTHSEVEMVVRDTNIIDMMYKVNMSNLGSLERVMKNGTI